MTSDGYRLVPARAADLPQIARLEALVFPEPMSLREVSAKSRHPATRYLVARQGSRVCAYFGFTLDPPTAHVIANATHPDHRRRGLATLLIQAGERVAAQSGARWFLGEVRRSNTVQMELLRELGWTVVGLCPRFFGNGEDAWVVWRLLPDMPE